MPNRRARRTPEEMQRIRDALYRAALDENPVTARRLFYRLVSDGVLAKTEAEYQGTVIRLLGVMREDDTIPFDWIADHTRLMRKPRTYKSLADGLANFQEAYRRALWAEQTCRVEIWCEKTGLTGVLYPVTAEWDVPLMICGGSPSKTFLYEAAQQIVAEGKPTHIYYLGDHDPSGVAIRERIERDLRRYANKFVGGEDIAIYFEHLAVTPDQLVEVRAHDGHRGTVALHVHVQVAVEIGDVEELLEVVGRDLALLLQAGAAGRAVALVALLVGVVVVAVLVGLVV